MDTDEIMGTDSDTFTQVRHRCLGCRRSWASKTRLKEHLADGCLKAPKNRACRTCIHYREGAPPAGREDPGSEPKCAVDVADNDIGYVRRCLSWEEL